MMISVINMMNDDSYYENILMGIEITDNILNTHPLIDENNNNKNNNYIKILSSIIRSNYNIKNYLSEAYVSRDEEKISDVIDRICLLSDNDLINIGISSIGLVYFPHQLVRFLDHHFKLKVPIDIKVLSIMFSLCVEHNDNSDFYKLSISYLLDYRDI